VIQAFVDRFMDGKDSLRETWRAKPPSEYKDIVTAVARLLANGDEWHTPDPERVHQIDDGDYQGTLVFVIGCAGYQPSAYWSVLVSYGSCSGCDTLQDILDYSETLSDEQLDRLVTLALHVVQKMKSMGDGYEDAV